MKKYELFKNYSRRSVLKYLGLGTAMPFMPVLTADAMDGAPKRILFITTPNGLGNGADPTSPGSSYTNGSAFKVLDPFKNQVNIFKGIDFKAWPDLFPRPRPNSHPALAPHLLTAAFTRPDAPVGANNNDQNLGYQSDGVSIDQFIASEFQKKNDTKTALGFIHAGVDTSTNQYARNVYASPKTPVLPTINNNALLRAVFDGASTGGGPDLDFQKRLAERRSVIDYAKEEIAAVRALLAVEDRIKMDEHLAGVADLERQLEFDEASGGGLECIEPELRNRPNVDEDEYRVDGENMLDIITHGFACDRARVATLQWSHSTDGTIFKSKYKSGEQQFKHHEATHGGGGIGYNDPRKKRARDTAAEWYADRFAYVIDKMSKIQESGGGTLLDNTVIVWTSEHSHDGEHSRRNIPFVTAGSAGGAMKAGHYFDFSNNRRGHGDLYATFANAVGLTHVNEFGGIPAIQDGIIDSVLA